MPSPPQAAGRTAHGAGGPPDGCLDSRLAALLRDVGAHVLRGETPSPAPRRRPTGLPDVDALLEGGFPEGRLSEIAGPAGSGRTSLALAFLARITAGDGLAALVDAADAFHPPSAVASGVVLDRLLWVRPRDLRGALHSAEQVLAAGGFAGVLLDLAGCGVAAGGGASGIPTAAWPRLRRSAAACSTALVVMAPRRLAGTFADLAVALEEGQPRFLPGPAWLSGMESRLCLVRSRSGPDGGTLSVGWRQSEGGVLFEPDPAQEPDRPLCIATPGKAPRRIRAA